MLRLRGGEVLLGPQAVLDALRVLQRVTAAYRVDGLPVPGRVTALIQALESARADTVPSSDDSSAVFRSLGDLPPSSRRVDVVEAARVLGVSTRRVRFMAGDLGGRKVGRAWVFDRNEIEEFARHRAQEGSAA